MNQLYLIVCQCFVSNQHFSSSSLASYFTLNIAQLLLSSLPGVKIIWRRSFQSEVYSEKKKKVPVTQGSAVICPSCLEVLQ